MKKLIGNYFCAFLLCIWPLVMPKSGGLEAAFLRMILTALFVIIFVVLAGLAGLAGAITYFYT